MRRQLEPISSQEMLNFLGDFLFADDYNLPHDRKPNAIAGAEPSRLVQGAIAPKIQKAPVQGAPYIY
jgi:hypothetical protein